MQLDPISSAYQDYASSPSPTSLHAVVKALGPTISYSLASIGAANHPTLRSHAKLFAADAVKKYDPSNASRASLPTFVSSQLQQMSRMSRKLRFPVQMPERVQLDALMLHKARKRYQDEHGREPDMAELADYTSMPVKRLEKIQRYQVAMPAEDAMGDVEKLNPDFMSEAVDYVHKDSDHTDRRILEMKTGYGGNPVMAPAEIGRALNLTPTQLSRRSMRISGKIQEIHSALEGTTS